ncbi:MAG: hypothetical protein KAX38_06255, partial [Candidatus Krumholzibacteria bacterium]|nr:hypothetical protein [Candidatus Krumholzibacteria bacterium]
GDLGYFYIEYENARIGENTSVITQYKNYDPSETILYLDDYGWWSSVGYGDGNDWGLVELTPTTNEYILAIDFWATGAPTSYTIYVYDDFDGSNLTNLLAGPISGSVPDAGYYSFALASPIPVSIGNAIYAVVDFNTYTYLYPVPMDSGGPMETNKSYISNNGTSWSALDLGNYAMGDIGIRARIGLVQEPSGCIMDGDPALYVDFGENARDVIAGETVCWTLGPCNFGFTNPLGHCDETDTFCVDVVESAGWTITVDPPLKQCVILDPGYLWWQDICITVPCDVQVCDYDTLIAIMAYCDTTGICAPDCGDCDDPNWYGGEPYYSADTVILHVIESPPALVIEQPESTLVGAGQTAAYIPFKICNADPCAPPSDYGYCITNVGSAHIPVINQCDTVTVAGGECVDVYGIINAGTAVECEYDTLTIIAWTVVPPIVYETCWQWIHVYEGTVPLFTTPVVTILVLAMILAAAVFMRRRAASRA